MSADVDQDGLVRWPEGDPWVDAGSGGLFAYLGVPACGGAGSGDGGCVPAAGVDGDGVPGGVVAAVVGAAA